MLRKLVFLLTLIVLFSPTHAQDGDIKPYLDAWNVADSSQNHRAQVFYDQLKAKKDTEEYRRVVSELHVYLEKHPDRRLEARTLLYETVGAGEFGYPREPYILLLQKAIRLGHLLGDDQLNAEIYSLYAQVASSENYLLYNLKALELERRIGFDHFSFVHNRYFNISSSLYGSQDYRQSIEYGIVCLGLSGKDVQHWEPMTYSFQLDILGAAYLKLKNYDSASWYYQKLLEVVPANQPTTRLWQAIAKGNLGRIQALQHHYAVALPLLTEYLATSTTFEDALNMSMADNALADVYEGQKEWGKALAAWKQALFWAEKAPSLENAMEAAKGLAGLLKTQGKTDSAFHYYALYYQHKDSLTSQLNRSRLTAMNARIAFDDLQYSFDRAQSSLNRERGIQRAMLMGAVALTVILFLLYNRYRLKQKYAFEMLRHRQQEAEREIKNARDQLAAFTGNIVAQNKMIEALEAEIGARAADRQDREDVLSLSQYSLLTDEDWEKFKFAFAKAYPDFLPALRSRIEKPTQGEERLATLLYLSLDTNQIAHSLGISKDSVLRSKRRLKLRLNLAESVTVEEFIFKDMIVK